MQQFDATTKAKTFRALHVRGDPLVLFNVWDVGTARIAAAAGARAIATASWAVAAAHGYEDGEALALETALQNLTRIVGAIDLPVTVDLESGYGRSPAQVAETVARALGVGAVGFNLEDQIIGEAGLFDVAAQGERIRAARKAADAAGVAAFVNARTDVFLKAGSEVSAHTLLNQAIERARAYHDAGADGFFAPGLVDAAAIRRLCEASPLPVNIMALPQAPDRTALAELGVARISYGPGPYQAAMARFTELAEAALPQSEAIRG